MQTKSMFLFVLIASIKLVNSVPLLEALLGGGDRSPVGGIPIVSGNILNGLPVAALTGNPISGISGGNKVNENGPLYSLNSLLAKPVCSVGLGCDACRGILESLQPPLGNTVNSLGIGVDCNGSEGQPKPKPGKNNNDDDCGCRRRQVPVGERKQGSYGGNLDGERSGDVGDIRRGGDGSSDCKDCNTGDC